MRVQVWDTRTGSEITSIAAGPSPANRVAVDRTGTIVAIASDDGSCKLFNIRDGKHEKELTGHKGAVQACGFDANNGFLITGAADGIFRMWS